MSIESSKTKFQRWKRIKKINKTSKNSGATTSYNVRVKGIPAGEEEENGTETTFKATMTENFFNLVSDTKTQT